MSFENSNNKLYLEIVVSFFRFFICNFALVNVLFILLF